VPIGPNGLAFKFGRQTFTYKDDRLGVMRLKNQRAIAWFNPENPETCGVTDMNGENPICVKRETSVPNHDAPAELLSQACLENASMERHAKEVYSAVKHVFSSDFEKRRFRPVIADGFAAETGAEFRRQGELLTAKDREEAALIKKAQRSASDIGMKLPSKARGRPEVVPALKRLSALFNEVEDQERAK